MPALASQPARPVCFVCSSSSGGDGGARLSSPTTRSVGRSAVAERAPNARITHSTGRAVRVARDSRRCAEVRLFAFETTSLAVARRRSPRSTRSPSSRSRCRVKIHVSVPSQAATSPCKNIRGRGQPARTAHHSVFTHSILHPYARNRVTDVTRRRNAVVVVGGGPPPLWFRRPRTALVQP